VPLLEIRNLDIYFKSRKKPIKVISQLNLSIEESEIFGLVGESGCGKSLTALSILGILPHNAYAKGEIIFKGRNLLNLSLDELRRLRGNEISMIFQEPMTSLNPVLKVKEQITEVLITHKRMSKKKAIEKAIELLKDVKIASPEKVIEFYPHQMSGGMRQRVMIAIALACDPDLLIADEPTTALDVTIQAQILGLLKNLCEQKKMSMLLITHDISVISENAERSAIMYAGRIMELSSVSNLFESPLHPYTKGLLDSLPKKRGIPLKPIPGYVPKPTKLPRGCKFSDRCSYVIEDCLTVEPDLREIVKGHFVRCIRAGEIN
jgi:oligopeptide/dipeptide ABC transporter ATP-binding protein